MYELMPTFRAPDSKSKLKAITSYISLHEKFEVLNFKATLIEF